MTHNLLDGYRGWFAPTQGPVERARADARRGPAPEARARSSRSAVESTRVITEQLHVDHVEPIHEVATTQVDTNSVAKIMLDLSETPRDPRSGARGVASQYNHTQDKFILEYLNVHGGQWSHLCEMYNRMYAPASPMSPAAMRRRASHLRDPRACSQRLIVHKISRLKLPKAQRPMRRAASPSLLHSNSTDVVTEDEGRKHCTVVPLSLVPLPDAVADVDDEESCENRNVRFVQNNRNDRNLRNNRGFVYTAEHDKYIVDFVQQHGSAWIQLEQAFNAHFSTSVHITRHALRSRFKRNMPNGHSVRLADASSSCCSSVATLMAEA